MCFHSKHGDYLQDGPPNIIYDIYHLNLNMPCQKIKVCHLLIIMLITVTLAPTAGAHFILNTIFLHIISLFKNCCFNYLKQN